MVARFRLLRGALQKNVLHRVRVEQHPPADAQMRHTTSSGFTAKPCSGNAQPGRRALQRQERFRNLCVAHTPSLDALSAKERTLRRGAI